MDYSKILLDLKKLVSSGETIQVFDVQVCFFKNNLYRIGVGYSFASVIARGWNDTEKWLEAKVADQAKKSSK